MDWDTMESILWQYYQGLPEPKISFESWWYGDNGVREALSNYVEKKETKPYRYEHMEKPMWARR